MVPCSVVPACTLFPLTTRCPYALSSRRVLEDVICQLQSLLDHNIMRRAVQASRVEAAIKDSVTKVEQALKKYEVRLVASVLMN